MTDEMRTRQAHTMGLDETRSGKTAAHVKLLTEMAKGSNDHTLVFGPTCAGMRGHYDVFRLTGDEVAKIAAKKD